MSKPLVTVLIDTYNHERFIEQAISSVLEQDFPASEREILVVDDGSTDNTPALVHKFVPHVRFLRKANGGQATAFNAAVPEARGEVIAFLDGDDWWARAKLGPVVEALDANPAVGMVGHGITEVYTDGRQQIAVLGELERFQVDTPQEARAFRLRKCFLGTSRMTIRTELLRRILPVPESLTIEADEYLFSLASVMADVLILPEPLTFYRIHSTNLYQISSFEEASAGRKQKVLSSLVGSLSERFRLLGVQPETVRTITEVIQAEADQLRLALEGGSPWETVQTELKIDRIMNERAPRSHRAMKYASLLPALFLPPRWFYNVKRRLTRNELYLRARARWIPIPKLPHVETHWKTVR